MTPKVTMYVAYLLISIVVLGVVHLFNVFALGRYRRNRMRQAALISAHHPPMPPAPIPMPPIPH